MASSAKTRFVAEESIWGFFLRHPVCYYWTFTFPGGDEAAKDKNVVEERLKPLRDLIRRKGKEELHFWELQERGVYHVHLLTDCYLEVNWLRPWLKERGWGPQMRVERCSPSGSVVLRHFEPGRYREQYGEDRNRSGEGLVRYLLKYLTKSLSSGFKSKKNFGGSHLAKVGTAQFKWAPWINPISYLFACGAELWEKLHECPLFAGVPRCSKWRSGGDPPIEEPESHKAKRAECEAARMARIGEIVRLGVEATGWLSIDPLFWETCGAPFK